jgi:hypothetical protein
MSRKPLVGKSELVIDFTGVGRPVFDLFVGRGITPVGVCITGSDAVTNDGPVFKGKFILSILRTRTTSETCMKEPF